MLIEQIFMIMEQNRRFADMLETLKKKGVVRNQQQFVEMVGVVSIRTE